MNTTNLSRIGWIMGSDTIQCWVYPSLLQPRELKLALLGSSWFHTASTGKASSRVVRLVPDLTGRRTKKGVVRGTAVTWHRDLADNR
jgi:hypothetical protein